MQMLSLSASTVLACTTRFPLSVIIPVDISGIVSGESPDCQFLSGTLVGENTERVCWENKPQRHSHEN